MNEEINTGNSEPEKNSVDNITASDFIMRRSQPAKEAEASQSVEETADETEVLGEPESESLDQIDTEEKSADVLSHMDLDSMSQDELKEISQKLGTKAVARFGELTARRKMAEERMVKMEQELANIKKDNTKQAPVVKNNPLANVTNVQELKKQNDSASEVIEWAEDLLDQHDDFKSTEVITEVEGKEMTKADVKKTLKQSRDIKEKFVPAQYANLQNNANIVRAQRAFQRKVLDEFTWAKDAKSKTTQQYKAMLGDKRLATLKQTNPELSAQMPYILAHAANSMFSRKPLATSKNTKITPPKSASNTAATPERKNSKLTSSQKEVKQRFSKSGNINDFIALRTLQNSQN
jgi:hypothetical protein